MCSTTSGFGFPGFGHNSPPVFDFKREWLIPENEPVGSRVITVRTRDEDRDSIDYSIDKAMFLDGSNYFTINPKNGDVFLKESLLGQAGNDFYLFITANDGHQTAKIEVFVRVLDADKNGSDLLLANMTSTNNNNNAAAVPVRRPFPPFISAQLPPQRPKDTAFITPATRKPTASPTAAEKRLLSAKPVANSTATGTLTAGQTVSTATKPSSASRPPSAAANQSIPAIQTNVPPKPVVVDTIDDNNPRGSANRTGDGLDMITAFLPLLAAVCFAPIAGLVFWILHHRCHKSSNRNLMKSISQKIATIEKGTTGSGSGTSSETSISSGMSAELDYNGALFQQIRAKKSLQNNRSAESNRYTSTLNIPLTEDNHHHRIQLEFPRHHLHFLSILGEGCFGQVWKCEAYNIFDNEKKDIVAVKTLKENASEKERSDLLTELQIMKMLDIHPNVVTMLGSCTERDPVFLIMEYVPYGTLQSYLRDSRERQSDRFYGNLHGSSSRLSARDLTSFAYQVAKAMEYLSSKGIIHRDLAARNVLVGTNNTVKVADFGFARDIIANHVYERKSEGRLPIRWMAIESLIDSIFTTKSDVWSFGVLMWEIVTLGGTPYPGLGAPDVIKYVRDGQRLPKPEHCKREMYNIMYYCWDGDADKRPAFDQLVDYLDKLLVSENDYIELDRFPDHCYYNTIPDLAGEKL
ncbi:tyrosine kinase receptor Cad96Ca-like [Oppia nitens]|uniref:tyrosine kinase receptor Cad96Ca-like n=1 Tax=Oppia nitens TaxID=1686743 RepID=UPI0023D9F7BC|nr:tyrosine kinase receptor Cad96Ca-like [Oppia nitens]